MMEPRGVMPCVRGGKESARSRIRSGSSYVAGPEQTNTHLTLVMSASETGLRPAGTGGGPTGTATRPPAWTCDSRTAGSVSPRVWDCPRPVLAVT